MKCTVLGGRGFIGHALTVHLRKIGLNVAVPNRDDLSLILDETKSLKLGHVIYCIGLTSDFRQYPLETVEAHVTLLARLIRRDAFESLTYLSSTRVYSGREETRECEGLCSLPTSNADSVYNLSKLTGESITLHATTRGRVVRLSNVYGEEDRSSGNFLSSVLLDAARTGHVIFRTSAESEKDYVALADVVDWLSRIALSGDFGIYNLASGLNTSNRELQVALEHMGVRCDYATGSPTVKFPSINIDKVSEEFGSPKHDVLSDLPKLFEHLKSTYKL